MRGCVSEIDAHGNSDVRDATVTNGKAFYVLAHLDDGPDGFLAGDKL
jgi:hypothetical protein